MLRWAAWATWAWAWAWAPAEWVAQEGWTARARRSARRLPHPHASLSIHPHADPRATRRPHPHAATHVCAAARHSTSANLRHHRPHHPHVRRSIEGGAYGVDNVGMGMGGTDECAVNGQVSSIVGAAFTRLFKRFQEPLIIASTWPASSHRWYRSTSEACACGLPDDRSFNRMVGLQGAGDDGYSLIDMRLCSG